jgi:enoyl-CoA hydratase/carnithine racemase
MPTICLINGHCFGAGFFLAISHDYRVQNPSKGFICLPEVDLGALMPSPIQTMFKQKLTPAQYRLLVFEGTKITGSQSLNARIVDAIGELDACLKIVTEKNLIAKAEGGVLGSLKEEAFMETLDAMDRYRDTLKWRKNIEKEKKAKRVIFNENDASKL